MTAPGATGSIWGAGVWGSDVWGVDVWGDAAESTTSVGKYAAEHAQALADIQAAQGFAEEHASALRDLADAGV